MQLFAPLIVLAYASTSALAWSHLFDRAAPGCLADNCLRAITGTAAGQTQTRVDRSADCSIYLLQTVTPTTITVTATALFTSSATSSMVTTTTTISPVTVTSITTTTLSTTAALAGNGQKRSVTSASTSSSPISSAIPAYASACTSAARYFSACSCAGWLSSTIVTAATPTFTTTVSLTSATTLDVLSTSIVDITSTATLDIVSTSTVVQAAACTSTALGDNLLIEGELPGYYQQIFTGTGVSETTNNPSLGDEPPLTTTFPASMDSCDAATACINFAFDSEGYYLNCDVHFLIEENEWLCVVYWNGGSSAADYSVANSDIGVAMGYQWSWAS